ncbi:thioredoxin family protein [Solimicrobium silvestre]|uniref:Thioredoxin n=1 Tax=Solimicrobium silvestre TaxID=2099400 RepID=A0A2S9GV22_9BURK|nr:thioredoxin family protein [Solimicrobium silvestre]PRC91506.1 Thioredoxin [Solimicrobium silvestre]
MPYLDLNHTSAAALQQHLTKYQTVVACLCAAWCDVCKDYRPKFEALAEQHPELLFLWIDIEDQASLVGDLDIENFPTLLIQQNDVVSFYGTMQPDTSQLKRIIQSQARQSPEQLQTQANFDGQQRLWQTEANLRLRLALAV